MNWKARAAYLFVLVPVLACLMLGKEYWPFTYFPMYSKRSNSFDWPQFQVKDKRTGTWADLSQEECFSPFGYVRIHFAIMEFYRSQRTDALLALQNRLANTTSCNHGQWSHLRIEIRHHDVHQTGFRNPRHPTPEVPFAH